MEKDEILENQEWIQKAAQGFAVMNIDEEVAHHPELLPQRDNLIAAQKMKIKEHIESIYVETVNELMSFEEALRVYLTTEPPVKQEQILKDFQKASEQLLSGNGMEALIQKVTQEGETMETALHISEETMQELYAVGRNLIAEKKYPAARGLFRFLTFLSPLSTDLWIAYGVSYLCSDRVGEAEEMFSIALSFDQENPDVLFHLAYCAFLSKNNEKALEYCSQVEAVVANTPEQGSLLAETRKLKASITGGES